jgi:hypothetical protein
MRVAIEFIAYNERRYSKPWIAKVVDWPTGKQPTLEFGVYIGSDSGGEVEIDADENDVIRYGQKDYRRSSSINSWARVDPYGNFIDITASEARKLYHKNAVKKEFSASQVRQSF